jgi:putative protease
MPYELIADHQVLPLGDQRYLLSPQDLAGLELIPELIRAGISTFKIEGRLKSPEYVANVTRLYRDAMDRALAGSARPVKPEERYRLEMSFSRGLYTGWLRGVNNQELVHARFGKKRGVFLGNVTRIQADRITLQLHAPVKAGDGVVFDRGHPEQPEEGGRIYSVDHSRYAKHQEVTLGFGRGDLTISRIQVGDRVWKTSDPELDRQVRQSFASDQPQSLRPLNLEIHGRVDLPLTLIARDELGHVVQVDSTLPLTAAHSHPLTTNRLQEQLGRLGNTGFTLGSLTNHLEGSVMLPVSELNALRRQCVDQLQYLRSQPQRWQITPSAQLCDLLPTVRQDPVRPDPTLIVLVRSLQQLQAALQPGITTLYCEFEDPRSYRQAVQWIRQTCRSAATPPSIWVAPPRISKPGETWILKQVKASAADGYLVRNYDQLEFFAGERCIGDFSLNVANALTADYLLQTFHLERLTASYDLNTQQLQDLLSSSPPQWYEVTIHQHMPMFHMEHCVFCAFLSQGTDYTNCGRPCEKIEVKLRDRVGTEHVLKADAGCRNTLFNGRAQTGAESVQRLLDLGLRYFRVEFVDESPDQVSRTIQRYQHLLGGQITASQLWRELKLLNQLGVTRGQMQNGV